MLFGSRYSTLKKTLICITILQKSKAKHLFISEPKYPSANIKKKLLCLLVLNWLIIIKQ